MAARQAVLNRESVEAATVPLPKTSDADITEQPRPPIAKRTISRIPNLKFGLGRRPASNPGRPREPLPVSTEVESAQASSQPDAAPASRSASRAPDRKGSLPASPSDLSEDKPPTRSVSEARLPVRQPSMVAVTGGGLQPLAMTPAAATDEAAQPPGLSVPAPRTAVPGALSEALMIERGRRRGIPIPAFPRIASSTGLPRSGVPSRSGTPDISPRQPGGAAAPKRAPRFKSVPTPMPGTPVPDSAAMENPLDAARADKAIELMQGPAEMPGSPEATRE